MSSCDRSNLQRDPSFVSLSSTVYGHVLGRILFGALLLSLGARANSFAAGAVLPIEFLYHPTNRN